MSLLTRRLPPALITLVVVAFAAWYFLGPRPWAADLAKTTVEACYASRQAGGEEGCAFENAAFRDANDAYGAIKGYRVVSVSRGLSNQYYTVTVETEREQGRTRDEAQVLADNGRERQPYAVMMDLAIAPR